MISALEKIQAAADKPKRSRSVGRRTAGDQPEPAMASFRGGAFAHSYISDGLKSPGSDGTQRMAKGIGGMWRSWMEAFSTHPTTEKRIARLRERGSDGPWGDQRLAVRLRVAVGTLSGAVGSPGPAHRI